REYAEHELRDERGDEKRRTVTALDLEYHAIDEVTDYAREEDHERIDYALDERERHHVAVGDVAHLVTEHRLGLILAHVVEEPGADRDERAVLVPAGRESVDLGRVVDRHF